MFLPYLVELQGPYIGAGCWEKSTAPGPAFWLVLLKAPALWPFGILEKNPQKHVWAEGGLMGLCNSCHHCQEGAHMLCNQWFTKPLTSQLPTQPGPGIAVCARSPAQTRRSGNPSHGEEAGCIAKAARFEGRNFEFLSYDRLVVSRLSWG